MIKEAITYLQAQVAATGMFTKIWGLCELINKDGKTYPAFYKGAGNYEDVSHFDRNDGVVYFRKNGDVRVENVDSEFQTTSCGSNELKYVIPIRAVGIIRKTKLASDSPYAGEIFAEFLIAALQNTSGLGIVLTATSAKSAVTSYSTNGNAILQNEYRLPSINEMNLRYSYISVDFELTIIKDINCIDSYCTNTVTGCIELQNTCGGDDVVVNDTFTGSINSSNTVFTTTYGYTSGTLMIYYNGIRLRKTTDYTETTSRTFTLTFVPQTGDNLIVDYIRQ